MPRYRVTFKPAGVTVEVDSAHYPYGQHGRAGSLLGIALTHGVHIEHACGGVGICGTCHVLVEAGAEHLSPATDDEIDAVDAVPGNALNSRLACQAVVAGDVTVVIPGWNRNAVPERS